MMFIVNLLARAETVDHVRDILIDLTRQTSAESGAVSYQAAQSTSDTTHFYVVEQYRDHAAWESHMASPYVRNALSVFNDLLREPPAAAALVVFAEYVAAPGDSHAI
ncbi:putative quinol monooxygenase [Mesorhizobium sp. M1348]|uniref:putative quinol monooxygenase n=2 Tax=Mesorhizobium TaxID=68287 RepID=UPI00333BAA4C